MRFYWIYQIFGASAAADVSWNSHLLLYSSYINSPQIHGTHCSYCLSSFQATDKFWQRWAELTNVTPWWMMLCLNSSPLLTTSSSTLTPISAVPLLSVPDLSLFSSLQTRFACHTVTSCRSTLSPPLLTLGSISFSPSETHNCAAFLWLRHSILFDALNLLLQSWVFLGPGWVLHQLCYTSSLHYTWLSAWLLSTDRIWCKAIVTERVGRGEIQQSGEEMNRGMVG